MEHRTPARGAVVFDFDGLLADSEDLHARAWGEILARRGVHVSDAEYRHQVIRSGRSVADLLRDRGLSFDLEALRVEKLAFHLAHIAGELRPMPGALQLLEALRGRMRLALASSGCPRHIAAGLAHLGLEGIFESVSSRDSVARPKPHPDVFLHAARTLGLEPSCCIVLEDAEKGVIAARAAGMRVIAVPTAHTADNDFSLATRVVASLHHVTPEMLEGLLAE